MSSQVPSIDEVYTLLREFYETYRFEWTYDRFFARLTGCASVHPFPTQAQTWMRANYKRFQRKSYVLDANQQMFGPAAREQAQIIAELCASAAHEGWFPLPGSTDESRQQMVSRDAQTQPRPMKGHEHPVFDLMRALPIHDLYENPFSAELGRLLGGGKRPYPSGSNYRGECDIVCGPSSGQTWIEVKHGYTYHSQKNPWEDNYAKLERWIFAEDSCSAVRDLKTKLPALFDQPGIASVGFLLVLFDSERFPLPQDLVERLRHDANLRAPWSEYIAPIWVNPNIAEPRSFIRSYYWDRPACTSRT